MRAVTIAAVVALAACCAARQEPADVTSARRLLEDAPGPWVAPDELLECGDAKRESLAPPPRAVVAAVFAATGTENYTCADGKWKVVGSKKDLYYADTGKYGGYLYVEADDIWNALYVFTDPSNTTELGYAVKDNQVTYDYKPLDFEVNRKWWRRPIVRASGIAAGSALVVKTDVQGGMPPDDTCENEGEPIYVPMNNTYTFYACAQPTPLPYREPKCEPPALEGFAGGAAAAASGDWQLGWEVTANGTRNWTCSDGQPAFFGAKCELADGGSCFYTEPEPGMEAGAVGYFVVQRDSGTYWLDTLKNTTAPAPTAGALDWAAWPASKILGEPHCDYVVRWDTSGGATPSDCSELEVPFSATYTCLQCPWG